jgi:hypothetical protein
MSSERRTQTLFLEFGTKPPPVTVKTPKPHHPDQGTMFAPDVDTTFATSEHPMTMTMAISLYRMPRQKCDACSQRRVCYYIGLGSTLRGPTMCAKCSGIR